MGFSVRNAGFAFCRGAYRQVKLLPEYMKRLVITADNRDKIEKFLSGYFGAVGFVVTEWTDAPDNVKAGFGNVSHGIDEARTVFSLVNIFGGIIQGTFQNVKTIGLIFIAVVVRDEATVPKSNAKMFGRYAPLHSYYGIGEKLLGLIIESAQALGNCGYIAGFGFFRPMRFFSLPRHFDNPTTANIGKMGFNVSMTVLHFFVLVGTVNLIHETIIYLRSRLEGLEDGGAGWNDKEMREITIQYVFVVVDTVLVWGEKGLELAKDIIILGKVKTHPAVIVAMNLGIGTLSLTIAIVRIIREVNFNYAEHH